jgi:hypothetical protein
MLGIAVATLKKTMHTHSIAKNTANAPSHARTKFEIKYYISQNLEVIKPEAGQRER